MDLMGLVIVGGFVAFMYMFIIRPQQRRQKEARDLMGSLTVGDDVITIGGLHGRLVSVDDTTVTVRADEGTDLVFEKTAIGQKVEAETVDIDTDTQ